MKTKRLPLFVVPLLLIVINTQAQTSTQPESPPWTSYTIPGEDFSVALPILPAFHTNYEYFKGVKKGRRVYSLGSYADGVVYVVFVYENPKRRESLESFIKNLPIPIPKSSLTDITLDGFPGKEAERSEVGIVSQFFATEHRIYHFTTLGTPVDNPRIKKFFSSLSLQRKQNSVAVVDGPGLPWEPPVEPEPATDETIKIYVGREVDRKVRLGLKVEPSYTEEARQNQITGTVVLRTVFSRNGAVTNIRTVSGLPEGLTERAIDAARKIKFIPAIKNGKYVSMWMQLEYNFNLY